RGGPADVHCEPGPAAGDVRRLRPRLATLRAGCYFGEISVLSLGRMGSRRTASVRSVGYSQLLCLARADLWAVLEDHPAARVQLEAIATRRLRAIEQRTTGEGPAPAGRRRVPGEGLVGQLAHRPQLLGQAVPRVWRLRQQPRPQQRRQEGAGKVTAAEQRQLRHKGRHPAGFSELTDGPVHLGQRLLGHRQGARSRSPPLSPRRSAESLPAARQPVRALLKTDAMDSNGLPCDKAGRQASVSQGAAGDCWRCSRRLP
uniref:Cyclic nucleotide-binding domain-containing protein n=1 Tax=Macrostomum lignano TaxID=282301 RepID=A0A1I8F7H6_9PLAT